MIFQMQPAALRMGVIVLTHLTSHPDIFWTEKNWISYKVRNRVTPHLIWSTTEIVQLMSFVNVEEWHRGGLGQHIYMLLIQDPDLDSKLLESISIFLNSKPDMAIFSCQILVFLAGENGMNCLNNILSIYPELNEHPLIKETRAILLDFGSVEIW